MAGYAIIDVENENIARHDWCRGEKYSTLFKVSLKIEFGTHPKNKQTRHCIENEIY
jgi:hypothetical protein